MESLEPGNYINDKVMTFYSEYLGRQYINPKQDQSIKLMSTEMLQVFKQTQNVKEELLEAFKTQKL